MVKVADYRLFDEAKRCIAGGVNSPVRSFKAVGGEPIFVKSGKGARLYSEDGREFIDYCLGWGSIVLGHADERVIERINKALDNGTNFGTPTKAETELARMIIDAIPSIERVRLTNSGTEAVMGALRLARAFTKKDLVIKFKGSYHGHADYLLDCPGVPNEFKKLTKTLPYNDIKAVKEATEKYRQNLAAIIVEPVAANIGVVPPKEGFLQGLREIADRHNIVLIFDEVITAFRLAIGGAQGFFGVTPDLTCLGKIMGSGLPIGAFGGRSDIMQSLAPEGSVYQAGTFSGNPISVTAALATLEILKETSPYKTLEEKTSLLCGEISKSAKRHNVELKINRVGSLFSIFFEPQERFKNFYHALLNEGVYFSPSPYEADFLSAAHTDEDIGHTAKAIDKIFNNLWR